MKEKTCNVQIKISKETHDVIKELAANEYLTIGSFSRHLLMHGLAAFRQKKALRDSMLENVTSDGQVS